MDTLYLREVFAIAELTSVLKTFICAGVSCTVLIPLIYAHDVLNATLYSKTLQYLVHQMLLFRVQIGLSSPNLLLYRKPNVTTV